LTAAISVPEDDDVEPEDAPPASTPPDADADNCQSYKASVPPPKKGRRGKGDVVAGLLQWTG